MIKPSNIIRHEIIGLDCEAHIPGKSETIKGLVLDETRNTLVLSTQKGKKTLIKEKYIFVFKLPDKGNVEVQGEKLVGRPEDRIKKKIEKW